jgi:hypothetical protein
MTTKRKYYTCVLSSALLLGLLGNVSVAWGQRNVFDAPDLPVAGIGGGQTLRVAIATFPPDPTGGDGQRCEGELGFINIETGLLVGPSHFISLGPGELDYADLRGKDLGLRRRQRADVQPVFAPSADIGPCREVAYSIMDPRGGAMSQALFPDLKTYGGCPTPWLANTFIPSPGWAQTFQYTVTRETQNFGISGMPLPCDITVNIRASGSATPVASLVTGALGPGQTASLSLLGNSLVGFGQTTSLGQKIIPSTVGIQVPFTSEQMCSVTTSDGCLTTIQIIDSGSSWTTVLGFSLQ